MKTWARWFVVVVVAVGWSVGAYANGYKILGVKDTKATSMGEAFVAQADNPSAITFNPAGMSQLRGNQVNLQATIVNAYTERTSPLGQETTDMKDRWQTVPSFFATTDLGTEYMAVGLGVSLPNGISSEWDKNSFARYVATYSDLLVADVSPAVGIRVSEKLMLGASLSYYYSEARLERMLDLGMMMGAPGMMDAESKLNGDGAAWGGAAAAIYRLNARHSVALVYHLPYSIEYDGDFEAAAAGIQSDVEATIDFPAVVVVGYAFKPTDKWTLECDLDWTDWEQVDDIVVHFTSPGMGDSVQQQDFKNTVAYKFGAEYKYSEKLALRGGYIYNENASSDETWRPSLPETDVHFLTGGVGYRIGGVTIDTALQLVYYETRAINNNVDLNETLTSSSVDGTYRTWAPCLSVSATYVF